MLNIYRISQDVNNSQEAFVVAVVIAKDEKEARKCHPYYGWDNFDTADWAHYDDVKVELIGTTLKKQKRCVVAAGLRE